MNLNHSQLYPFNNYHHLHPYPAKPSSSSRHHPPHHHSTINLTQNQLYHNNNNNEVNEVFANETDSESNLPLNRFHRNATSSLNSNTITSSVSAFLLPTTTTISSLIKTTNLANSNHNRSETIDWMLNQLHSINGSVSTTPLQPPITVESSNEVVLKADQADVFVDSEANSHQWSTANDIPILIGAAAGGLVLLIVLIILLVIWNCCDTNCNGDSDRDNGSATRSNRSSLSGGSCGSSGSGHAANGAKRNSSSLYINNPNSVEVEHGGLPDVSGAIHHHGHYHYTSYDYGPGPGGGGVAQLVIQNNRVLTSAQQQQDNNNAIPRSVSVPLSRSNSHKDSGSAKQSTAAQPLPSHYVVVPGGATGYLPAAGADPLPRSQLSQALTRNIGTYYETQRKKNAKSKNGSTCAITGDVGGIGPDKSSIILNDLSLNMDMVFSEGQYGNVIVNNPSGQNQNAQWILLEPTGQQLQTEVADHEANNVQSEFYRTRSLPWSQSSRKFSGASAASGPAESHPDSNATIHSGTTTMGRVNYTKKRRNRMRNDSAAAIALNRSGFLGGSLDWDLPGAGRDESDSGLTSNGRPALASLTSTSANTNQDHRPSPLVISPIQVTQPQASDTNTNKKSTSSPDSPEYLAANESIVVYNERTAL